MPHVARRRARRPCTGTPCSRSNCLLLVVGRRHGLGPVPADDGDDDRQRRHGDAPRRWWTSSATKSSTVPQAATNGQIDGPATRKTSCGSAVGGARDEGGPPRQRPLRRGPGRSAHSARLAACAGRPGPTAGGGCARSAGPTSRGPAAARAPPTPACRRPTGWRRPARPAERLWTRFTTNTAMPRNDDERADGRDEVVDAPARAGVVGVDPPRHAQQPDDVHREERHVDADEQQPEVPACRAARRAACR